MSTELSWQITSTGSADTSRLGELLGSKLHGGTVVELASDLGGGKTTFTQGLAKGLGSKDTVVSPTFTLSKIYKGRGGLEIHHFDFYRLSEAGIIADQLAESISDERVVTVVEWSDIVRDVLPQNRISLRFELTANDPEERMITLNYSENHAGLIKEVRTKWEEVRP